MGKETAAGRCNKAFYFVIISTVVFILEANYFSCFSFFTWVCYSALALQQTEADLFFKVPFRAEQLWYCIGQGNSAVKVCRAPRKQGSSGQSAVTKAQISMVIRMHFGKLQKAKNEPFRCKLHKGANCLFGSFLPLQPAKEKMSRSVHLKKLSNLSSACTNCHISY